MRLPTLVLSLILVLAASQAGAATYLVAPSGNDAHDGSLHKPWRTFRHAVAKLDAGDRLYVRRGVYREAVTIWKKRGTETAPIVIAAYGREKPIIDGRGIGAGAIVAIGDSSWVRFEGFEVRNGAKDGIHLRDVQHVTVRWNTVHHCRGYGILAASAKESPTHTTRDVQIRENTVHHCVLANRSRSEGNGWLQAVAAYRALRVEISGNTVHQNFGEGIDYILSDGGVIRGNQVWDNFSVNIYLDNAQQTRVEENTVSCSEKLSRGGQRAGGIAAANEFYAEQNPLRDLTIAGNRVTRCLYGFHYRDSELGGGLQETVIANNVFYSTEYALIWIEGTRHSSTSITKNVFDQKYGRPYAESATAGITYRDNQWVGEGDRSTIIE